MTPWVFLLTMMIHPPCEVVSGDQISAADLSRIVPAFTAMPRDVVVGYSPAPGARRIFQFQELKRIGAQYRISVPLDSQACFQWKMQHLTEDAVRAAIRESIQAPEAKVEVLAMSKEPGPEGKLSFPQNGLSAATNTGASTPVTWRGYITYNSTRRFAVWARVRVSAAMPRVVAVEPLTPGKPVSKEQVRLETSADFPLRNDTARSLDEVIGRVPRRTVRSGLPVMRSDLSEAFQVERGQTVQVTAVSGAAQLELEGTAEASGRQGDVISVRNPRSGKLFRARIEGKGRAIVLVGAAGLLVRAQ